MYFGFLTTFCLANIECFLGFIFLSREIRECLTFSLLTQDIFKRSFKLCPHKSKKILKSVGEEVLEERAEIMMSF